MIKILPHLFLLTVFGLISSLDLQGQLLRCATNEVRAAHFSQDSNWRNHQEKIIQHAQQRIAVEQRSTIRIPVVVHIVWNEEEENISDEQIHAQIEILNQDFRATNVEVSNIPAVFRNVFADTEIEFCLTTIDYRGRATDGINRVFTNEIGIAGNSAIIKSSSFGGEDAWDTNKFLNIWVGRRNDGILAEATLPGEAEDGEDGIVIDYRAFGNLGTAANNTPYNLGRTLTHEVGHYLGLQHLWGEGINNENCDKDDSLDDTPFQELTYSQECPSEEKMSCNSLDMYMNFMNYTDDACMSIFTQDQKMRMQAVLSSLRKDLRAGDICAQISLAESVLFEKDVKIYPNPAHDWVNIEISTNLASTVHATLYNALGQAVQHFEIANRKTYALEVQNLAAGIYYLKILSKNQYITKPILLHPN